MNVAKDEWTRRQRARRFVFFDDAPVERRDPAPDPEQLWERSRFQAAVEAALGGLSLRERTVLTLYFQEQRSYGEIAAILGAPMGTVKTQLHRARQRLKTAMREWLTPCRTIR
ncbi:MAG: sigma-70 family RNA polymerase sigma factor [Acidobacteriota bacterium]